MRIGAVTGAPGDGGYNPSSSKVGLIQPHQGPVAPLVRGGENAAAEEAASRAVELLETLPPSRPLAVAYRVRAHLRMLDRDNAVAIRWGRKAIGLARRLKDDATRAAAENVVGSAMLVDGNEDGRAHLERSKAIAAAADKVRITENEDYERQYPARG